MRMKATVAYDGSDYAGWQKQPNAKSIESTIEKALSKIHNQEMKIVASGRTDAKVHALGQVFHFDTDLPMDGDAYKRALNALLPKDIRILSVEEVDDHFHARFSATGKRYDYYLTNDIDNPFKANYMGKERMELDVVLMQKASKVFLGTHDFTTFTSAKIDARKSRIRTLTRFDIEQNQLDYHFILEGNAFLRYMARMIVATIVECGKGKLADDEIKCMLDSKDKHACRFKADACGLYLVEVRYDKK